MVRGLPIQGVGFAKPEYQTAFVRREAHHDKVTQLRKHVHRTACAFTQRGECVVTLCAVALNDAGMGLITQPRACIDIAGGGFILNDEQTDVWIV